uniref:(northern house mosquito) hypothetical protein n=1 Tax=Culex pipiens TaxID=7175 RepID=A0A8D8A6R1_CULPI
MCLFTRSHQKTFHRDSSIESSRALAAGSATVAAAATQAYFDFGGPREATFSVAKFGPFRHQIPPNSVRFRWRPTFGVDSGRSITAQIASTSLFLRKTCRTYASPTSPNLSLLARFRR